MKYWQKPTDNTTAVMKFYGVINMWWIGADDYSNTIAEIERLGYKNLEILTHCPGGSVFEGNAIWVANRRSKLNITFKVDGIAASMMAVILLSGDSVEMSSVAKVMVHPPRSYGDGQAKDHFAIGKLLKSMEKDFVRLWMEKTGQKEADVLKLLDGADNWLDAEECLKIGLAQKIYDATEFTTDLTSKPDANTSVDSVFNRYTALDNNSVIFQTSKMDKQKLITSLGLTGVTAQSSDTAIEEAIIAKSIADAASFSALQGQKKSEDAVVAASLIAARQTELNTTFTVEQKASLDEIVKEGGIKALKPALAVMTGVPNLTAQISVEQRTTVPQAAGSERKDWGLKDWAENDPEGLEKLSLSSKPEDKALFNKMYVAEYGAI